MTFNKQNKLITGKDPTLAQVCNNSTLQRQDLESHHKEDLIIYQLASMASGAGDNAKNSMMLQMLSSYLFLYLKTKDCKNNLDSPSCP